MRVDYSLEYENLEKFYLEFFLTSKISATVVSKKNDGNLEINLEKVNLEKVVGNLILTHSLPAKNRLCGSFSYLG